MFSSLLYLCKISLWDLLLDIINEKTIIDRYHLLFRESKNGLKISLLKKMKNTAMMKRAKKEKPLAQLVHQTKTTMNNHKNWLGVR